MNQGDGLFGGGDYEDASNLFGTASNSIFDTLAAAPATSAVAPPSNPHPAAVSSQPFSSIHNNNSFASAPITATKVDSNPPVYQNDFSYGYQGYSTDTYGDHPSSSYYGYAAGTTTSTLGSTSTGPNEKKTANFAYDFPEEIDFSRTVSKKKQYSLPSASTYPVYPSTVNALSPITTSSTTWSQADTATTTSNSFGYGVTLDYSEKPLSAYPANEPEKLTSSPFTAMTTTATVDYSSNHNYTTNFEYSQPAQTTFANSDSFPVVEMENAVLSTDFAPANTGFFEESTTFDLYSYHTDTALQPPLETHEAATFSMNTENSHTSTVTPPAAAASAVPSVTSSGYTFDYGSTGELGSNAKISAASPVTNQNFFEESPFGLYSYHREATKTPSRSIHKEEPSASPVKIEASMLTDLGEAVEDVNIKDPTFFESAVGAFGTLVAGGGPVLQTANSQQTTNRGPVEDLDDLFLGATTATAATAATTAVTTNTFVKSNNNLPPSRKPSAIVSFGIGGTMVISHPRKTYFTQDQVSYTAGMVHVVKMADYATRVTLLNTSPIFNDPRTSRRNKKKEILELFQQKIEHFSFYQQGQVDAQSKSKYQSQALLWQLLRLIIEYDNNNTNVEADFKQLLMADSTVPLLMQDSFSSAGPQMMAKTTSSPSALLELKQLLLTGDRQNALQLAQNQGLWAYALLIASSMEKDVWQSCIFSFLNAETTVLEEVGGLKAGLTFLAGGAVTDTNAWQESLAMLLANRNSSSRSAIAQLGDALKNQTQNIDAAHLCYLLSGCEFNRNLMVLLGVEPTLPGFFSNHEALFLSESYEFALNNCLPHLQGYKLQYAMTLLDFGHVQEAGRYCEAIANSAVSQSNGSPYFHSWLINCLSDFSSRLAKLPKGDTQATAVASAVSWFSRVPKPTFKSVISSVENSITRFITGDDLAEQKIVGPFAAAAAAVPSRPISTGPFSPAIAATTIRDYPQMPQQSSQTTTSVYWANLDHQKSEVPEPMAPPPTRFAEEDEEDLGFGNSSLSKKKAVEDKPADKPAEKPAERTTEQANNGGGFLSGLKKLFGTGGPVKANLGDPNSLYYDPDQKRWVSGKAAPTSSAAPTVRSSEPPSRSSTPSQPPAPPPSSTASFADYRASSSSSPIGSRYQTPPPPPSSTPLPPPPPPPASFSGPPPAMSGSLISASLPSSPRPGTEASPRMGGKGRKSARARYVDIMQQE